MGIGYSASAFHRISYLVEGEDTASIVEPPPWLRNIGIEGIRRHTGPMRFHSPLVEGIELWREGFAARQEPQIGEIVSWDEANDFSLSEDVYASDDTMLRYVAAVVEVEGEKAARRLVGAERPGYPEIGRIFDSFDGVSELLRFPQLLLTDLYWLPYHRNVVVDDEDWQGERHRFGSTFRLADELRDLRTLIAALDPNAIEGAESFETPLPPLPAAWRVSEVVVKICGAAVERKLPLWTTG